VRIRRPDDRRETTFAIAADDASRSALAGTSLLESGAGVQWYDTPGSTADLAALSLCRLRRARAGQGGGPQHGDGAVREVLGQASPESLVWIASRAIAYMDENGFPEDLERYLGDSG
jgi:hypothetical protein